MNRYDNFKLREYTTHFIKESLEFNSFYFILKKHIYQNFKCRDSLLDYEDFP